MKKIWEEKHIVDWDQTTVNGQISLGALNLYLIGAAINHAEHLGFGYNTISKEGISWVLFRINIDIKRLPSKGEAVVVTTWPRSIRGISASRDFEMHLEESGELLCAVTSDWLIIDLKTRKPQRLDRFNSENCICPDKKAVSLKVPKVNFKSEFADLYKIKTYYSDIDMNGHVIAHKYFSWLEDAINKIHGEKELSFIQMNYFNECDKDEDIQIKYSKEDDTNIMGVKLNNDKPAFSAKVVFK